MVTGRRRGRHPGRGGRRVGGAARSSRSGRSTARPRGRAARTRRRDGAHRCRGRVRRSRSGRPAGRSSRSPTVIGAPAPTPMRAVARDASGPRGRGVEPSTDPSATTGGPTNSPSSSTGVPTSSPSATALPAPTARTTVRATTRPRPPHAADHVERRAGVGDDDERTSSTASSWDETLTLSGLVTDQAGEPLAGHAVVLQVRGPGVQHAVVETTADASGARRPAGHRRHSERPLPLARRPRCASARWLVRMVPTRWRSQPMSAAVGPHSRSPRRARAAVIGSVFGISPATSHSSGGGASTPRARARSPVLTPRRARDVRRPSCCRRNVTEPPALGPRRTSRSGERHDRGLRDPRRGRWDAAIGGTVTAASARCRARKVVLLRRGPLRWRPVGHATSDAAGHVSIATPAITATSAPVCGCAPRRQREVARHQGRT